jgi:flagellin-specific chaperone FliS
MPTVFRQDGFRFIIYLNDHEPAHVHIQKGGGEIKVNIASLGDIQVMKIVGMKNQEALKALKLVSQNQQFLLKKWEEIHG